ncbi:hypothetical protein FACS1894200_13860 [Spirochaetia bacterium]|nr:hypothetical protein FACS1894200_13860 [Spirochaetia bacterium]
MLLTFQGFFEDGRFVSSEPVKIPEGKKAIVSILDEEMERKLEALEETGKQQKADWEECLRLLDESMDEEVPDFPRAHLHREIDI